MTGPEQLYTMLLRAYPRAYRDERGDELLGTLLDASASQGIIRNIGDAIDLVVHGLQLRAGLTGDRYAGRVLGMAALPGFVMAATLAVVAFVFGEWIPMLTHQAIRLSFGPFMTMAPVLYLLWSIGALFVLARPRFQRPVAIICVLATILFVPFSDALRYGRPPMILLVVLIGLGFPSTLAPQLVHGHSRKVRPLIVVGVVVATTLSLLTQVVNSAYNGEVFYWRGLRELAFWMPVIAAGLLVLIGGALVMRRRDTAGTIAVLALPWALVGAWSPIDGSMAAIGLPTSALLVNTGFCVLLAAGLLAVWIGDLRRRRGAGLGNSGGLDSLNLES